MAKEIIVNADVRESRIAVREDGQLVELHIEREERVVGSIYMGRVESVPHGLDAAFVDIGLDRNAYLSAGDIVGEGGGTTSGKGGDKAADTEPADSAEAGAGNGFDRRGRRPRPTGSIGQLVKRGQELLVQVVKGPRGSKGARVSTRISLPGRYLVFMPDENSVGVSRKIDDPKERDRLKRIVESIRKPGYGLIVRTEAEDKTERELRQDLDFLERTWAEIKRKASATRAPNLVYQDLTLLFRILRDAFGQDVDKLILDSAADYRQAHELLDFFGPSLKDRVELFDGDKPIFEHYGLEQEIEKLLGRRVWLKSGGYLVIDQAEALVAIDVNSGRYTGTTTGLKDTILKTNLEAVGEIARQLRLRDMGGILVLDLIDMDSAAERKQVEQALETALKHDKSRCKISHISPLGLVEMTRKRTGETVNEQMNDSCPYCQGAGKIQSAESVAIAIERDLRRLSRARPEVEAFHVVCNAQVAAYLIGENGEDIERLEHNIQRGLYIRVSDSIHQEKYEIQPGKLDDFDRKLTPYQRNQVIDVMVDRNPFAAPPAATAHTLDGGYFVELPQGARHIGQNVRVRLQKVGRSIAEGEALGGGGGGRGPNGAPPPPPGDRSERTERGDRGDKTDRGDRDRQNQPSGQRTGGGSNDGRRRRRGGSPAPREPQPA